MARSAPRTVRRVVAVWYPSGLGRTALASFFAGFIGILLPSGGASRGRPPDDRRKSVVPGKAGPSLPEAGYLPAAIVFGCPEIRRGPLSHECLRRLAGSRPDRTLAETEGAMISRRDESFPCPN